METTAEFPDYGGDSGFIAIQGKVYHRVRPSHANSAVRWILYDGFLPASAPHHDSHAQRLPPAWVRAMQLGLIRVNPFVLYLKVLSQLPPQLCPNASVIVEDTGTATEIAAFMSYENTALAEVRPRRLIVSRLDDRNHAIPTTSRLWEPLAYPLFFPSGTLGWGVVGNDDQLRQGNQANAAIGVGVDQATTQIWYYRLLLLREDRFALFGRLTNEYLVDMFTRNLECRLKYIRDNQHAVLVEDARLMGEDAVEPTQDIYLPSSFLGSNRWASEQIADSLAIAAHFGTPTFFITMTCNPKWREITSQLRPGQTHTHVPLVVARVFKQKLRRLEQLLASMFPQAGRVVYLVHSVEFQKRGLPHAHILVKYAADCVSPDAIDSVISAEMPVNDDDARLVRSHMLHKHPSAYCQREKNGVTECRFHYPHPIRPTTTIDPSGRVLYRRRSPEDLWVVPHCLPLLRAFDCHINFEAANSSHLFQYIFKYIHKGPDRARYMVRAPGAAIDEIEDYWNARYLSAGEAAWRILGFHITRKEPSVTALPVHLPDATNHRQYRRRDNSQENSLSFLDRYFVRPIGDFLSAPGVIRSFDSLTYSEYYTIFRIAKYDPAKAGRLNYFNETHPHDSLAVRMHVILRSTGSRHVARIRAARPSEGERYYLRALLQHRPARSFQDMLTVDGLQHDSYQLASAALGLFADQNEGDLAMLEAIASLYTPHQLRVLFAHLLVNDCIPTPAVLWNDVRVHLSLDHIFRHENHEELGVNHALQELSTYLEEHGKSLADYGLPEPTMYSAEVEHELERWNAQRPEMGSRADDALGVLNPEQRAIFDVIVNAALTGTTLLAFIDGKAGRGKTFLINTICDYLRAREHIVVPTATSGYAAQLYPGGRTMHSAFKVPVNERNEMLKSPIAARSSRAELLARAAAIMWDEAPMANKAVLACVDDTSRTIMDNDLPFGGKVFVLLGDFRQTCPVVRHGSRADVVDASIKSSSLWRHFTIFRLTTPIRNAEDPEFAEFVDAIGDGAGPDVALDMLDRVDTEAGLIDFVFPDSVLTQPHLCCRRSILAPTNAQVDAYNETIVSRVHGEQRTYLAADVEKTLSQERDLWNIVKARSKRLAYKVATRVRCPYVDRV
ncbi:ATP-dependent DNA helicase PIF1 [Phanerochaete sordida]|uniref:ATP-dependent DNA helicase n=1 Tax=Phanerochaete sordida TaxID=48140 RepID=A0A9P3LDB3_9APHY|nr:ATP-dependent DNA helicase PIF1 [Phanerochaete sordida]